MCTDPHDVCGYSPEHAHIIGCELLMRTLSEAACCAPQTGHIRGYQPPSCRESGPNQLKVIHCTPCEHMHKKKVPFQVLAYRPQDPSVLLSTSERKWSVNITKATELWPCKREPQLALKDEGEKKRKKSAVLRRNQVARFV